MPIGMKSQPPRERKKPSRGGFSDEELPVGAVESIDDSKASTKNSARKSSAKNSANRVATKKVQKVNQVSEDNYEDDYEDNRPKSGTVGIATYVLIGIVVVLVVAVAIAFFKGKNKESTDDLVDNSVIETEYSEPVQQDSYLYDDNGNPIYDSYGDVVNEDAIDPGFSDKSNTVFGNVGSAPKEIYDADDYIKDINGVDVAAVYNVDSVDEVIDYVNYSKKRAIIDDGMEMYWVEVVYEGKKYRVQVPFRTFRYLKDKGICKMKMEVLNISGGGKIISYMSAVNDDNTPM